jgi:hypothetical protein
MSEHPDLDELQLAYKNAVEGWIAAIRKEEELASVNHDVAEVDKWEEAHFAEDEMRSNVKEAKAKYEDALREKFFGFLLSLRRRRSPLPTGEVRTHDQLRQNSGSAGSSRPPIRTGPIFVASPVVSSVSTATPESVATPPAGSKRPEGIPDVKRRIGSSFCMPMTES